MYLQNGATDVCFGFDRQAKEGQGTTLSDLFTVFRWRRDWPIWYTAVIEYSPADKDCLPIDDGNPHWAKTYRRWSCSPP
jgi:hypothetical protein